MRQTLKFFKISTMVFLLASCQGQKEIIRETQIISPNQQGGVDQTGGGNGVNGVALDKYIEPVISKPAYKEFVANITATLSRDFPRLAADFYHISINRDWYFIPISLPEISNKILGTYAKTDQLALQDLNKIWIDKSKYEQMTVENQGVLIVHEIMMGIKLMKYKERQDRCIAKAASYMVQEKVGQEQEELYRKEKKYCRSNYPTIDGTQNTKFSLTNDDYDFIRKLVSKLIQSNIDTDELKSLIETYQFRNYAD